MALLCGEGRGVGKRKRKGREERRGKVQRGLERKGERRREKRREERRGEQRRGKETNYSKMSYTQRVVKKFLKGHRAYRRYSGISSSAISLINLNAEFWQCIARKPRRTGYTSKEFSNS